MSGKAVLSRVRQSIYTYQTASVTGISLWWLGQAGFLIRRGGTTIVIDAYLSDALARKYRGRKYPHRRMMPPPIRAEDLSAIDFYLITHGHSDHLDPEAAATVARNNLNCRFIMPEAIRGTGIQRGIPDERIIGTDEGSTIPLGPDMELTAIPSAHEEITKNEKGLNLFLGYVIRAKELTLYHTGDGLPYPGLDRYLDPHAIDLALIPVNGRKEELAEEGIAGNFDIDEAIELTRRHRIPFMIPHHFGMFEFNTADPAYLNERIEDKDLIRSVFPAETGIRYDLTKYEY